jgi:hypothetical protein
MGVKVVDQKSMFMADMKAALLGDLAWIEDNIKKLYPAEFARVGSIKPAIKWVKSRDCIVIDDYFAILNWLPILTRLSHLGWRCQFTIPQAYRNYGFSIDDDWRLEGVQPFLRDFAGAQVKFIDDTPIENFMKKYSKFSTNPLFYVTSELENAFIPRAKSIIVETNKGHLVRILLKSVYDRIYPSRLSDNFIVQENYIRLPTFAGRQSHNALMNVIDTLNYVIKRYNKITLDIRDNLGGNINPYVYLITKLLYPDSTFFNNATVYHKVSADTVNEYADYEVDTASNIGKSFRVNAFTGIINRYQDYMEQFKTRYTGIIEILYNSNSASASVVLLKALVISEGHYIVDNVQKLIRPTKASKIVLRGNKHATPAGDGSVIQKELPSKIFNIYIPTTYFDCGFPDYHIDK